ncbi:MAG TPA: glutathione S-transferase family protein [Ramlibacter sp.]|uniref:glutathione S-transferase family protein n=1 Tax=Ramlibacter sp. TaxID=1917967 RepID=UPI002CE2A6EC|nr:glutathione S-transferase family protein [Ramlibacter sp.]HVZ42672.1 glutathione S-transferase family protein [Ramlibacter sp.]
MAIELYSFPRSSGTRVSWALEELALPYRFIEIDLKKKEQLSPAYLAIDPHGKVPALVDGEQRFFESIAILLHLAHRYAVDKGMWPAPGSALRADAISWLVWSGTELSPHMMQYVYHGLDSPFSYKPEDRSGACAEYNRGQFERMLRTLEERFSDREWLVGSGFTLADLACAGALGFGMLCGIGLGDYPKTAAWVKRCGDRPARARAR